MQIPTGIPIPTLNFAGIRDWKKDPGSRVIGIPVGIPVDPWTGGVNKIAFIADKYIYSRLPILNRRFTVSPYYIYRVGFTYKFSACGGLCGLA